MKPKVTATYFSTKDLKLTQKVLARWIGETYVDDRAAIKAWAVINRFIERELTGNGGREPGKIISRSYRP